MKRIASLLRTHTLLAGFVVALVPLLLMLGLQYVWLSKLEQASAIAHQAAQSNYLQAVGTEVEFFYRSSAERLLNVPAALFQGTDLSKIAFHWKSKTRKGVRRLFVIDFTIVPTGNFYVYEPATESLVPTSASDESLAILLAALPWQSKALTSAPTEPGGLQVEERDPNHRIILSPVVGEDSKMLGVVGMILDEPYFRDTLLKTAVEGALPTFFANDAREDIVVAVRNERQELVLGEPPKAPSKPAVTSRFPFVFKDWTLALTSFGPTAEQMAGGTFSYNMALGLLLSVVLISGIGMALRSANRAMRLSEMKSDFVSNVSHELRTPLASVRVFAELLRHGRVTAPEKVQEYGEYIETETRRLSRLIDNILDFSRIESKQKVYKYEPTDILEVVRSAAHAFEVRLERAGFRLRLQLPEASEGLVEIDADAIGQTLHNLLDNAAKYSEPGSEIVLRVAWQGDRVVISVQDHGIGIAKDHQRRIFERFHRVGTGLVHDVKGSGLGLAIVDHVTKAHGGAITVESELGSGSTFAVRLPLKQNQARVGADPATATTT